MPSCQERFSSPPTKLLTDSSATLPNYPIQWRTQWSCHFPRIADIPNSPGAHSDRRHLGWGGTAECRGPRETDGRAAEVALAGLGPAGRAGRAPGGGRVTVSAPQGRELRWTELQPVWDHNAGSHVFIRSLIPRRLKGLICWTLSQRGMKQ